MQQCYGPDDQIIGIVEFSKSDYEDIQLESISSRSKQAQKKDIEVIRSNLVHEIDKILSKNSYGNLPSLRKGTSSL